MRHDVATCCVRVAALSAARVHFESTRGFYFVSASYQGRSLVSAASHLVQAAKEALGPKHPHLVTLFATAHDEWGAGLADTPQYVRSLLSSPGVPPPVVLGGVLRSITCGPHSSHDTQPCVALLAAHLPGVKILPFHAAHGSLPSLSGGSWADVMRAARPLVPQHHVLPTAPAPAATAPPAAPHLGDTANRGVPGQRTQHSATASSCLPHGGMTASTNAGSASTTSTSMPLQAAAQSSPGVLAGWPHPRPSYPNSSGGLLKAEAGHRAGGASRGGAGGQQPSAAGADRPLAYCQPKQHPQPQQQPQQHAQQQAQHHHHELWSAGRAVEPSTHAGGIGMVGPERSERVVTSSGRVAGGVGGGTWGSLPQVAEGGGRDEGVDVALAAAPAAAGRLPHVHPQSPPRESVAALLLSTPHFMGQVEELLRRVGLVAPGMQVVGGVTAPGVWGDSEGDWGAVWLNDSTFAQGAVGCVLQGPFKLDTLVSPGFRGAGPLMRVTQAQGPAVLELDGESVQRPLQRAIAAALSSGDAATSLKMGVGEPGSPAGPASSSTTPPASFPPSSPPSSHHRQHHNREHQLASPPTSSPPLHPDMPHAQQHTTLPSQPISEEHTQQHKPQQHQQQVQVLYPPQHQQHKHHPLEQLSPATPPPDEEQPAVPQQHPHLVTRNWFFHRGPPRPHLTIQSSGPIASGTPIQLHLQNYPAAQHQMQCAVQHYAQELPPGLVTRTGGVGALALSCATLPFSEQPDVAQWLPGAAFLGGRVEGELCAISAGQSPRLHSFTSCLALLRPADQDPNDGGGQELCNGGAGGAGEPGTGAGLAAVSTSGGGGAAATVAQ